MGTSIMQIRGLRLCINTMPPYYTNAAHMSESPSLAHQVISGYTCVEYHVASIVCFLCWTNHHPCHRGRNN